MELNMRGKKMRIAIIQDQLLTKGGSERVFLYLAREFPEADLYSFCLNRNTVVSGVECFLIKTHPFGYFVRNHSVFKWFFPVCTILMSRWDFSQYDIVLTSSATTAKYIKRFTGKHVCYCYYPTRALWETSKYFGGSRIGRNFILNTIITILKRRDLEAAKRVDDFIAISKTSQSAIKNYYNRSSTVICPPVDTEFYGRYSSVKKQDWFLIVSRLEKWKMLEYAIDAFNSNGFKLKIVGEGPDGPHLRKRAYSNIEFVGSVSDSVLGEMYAASRAVIFTPELEYGLVPLEAIAAGTPVIALGKGGVLETMSDVNGFPNERVCVLYSNATSEDLNSAIEIFRRRKYFKGDLIAHASKYSVPEFNRQIRLFVSNCIN
jgi:glycosyltransferase involved in cell wall biosynthesis